MNTTPTLQVRPFQQSDREAVIAIWNDVLPSSTAWNEPGWVIDRKVARDGDLFFVGELDGNVVATVMAGFDGVRGWIYAMAVARDQQRKGLGRQIMEHALSRLNSLGCDKVNLQVRATNLPVVQFYESLGFETEERASMGLALGEEIVADEPIDVRDGIMLTRFKADDADTIMGHFNYSPRIFKYLCLLPNPYEKRHATSWLRKQTNGPRFGRFQNWAIRASDGEVIGGIGMKHLTQGATAEVGYWLCEPMWGQGIMPQVVQTLCDHCFDVFDLQRIEAMVVVGNDASCRVLQKSGFEKEGVLRNKLLSQGEWVDATIWGKIR